MSASPDTVDKRAWLRDGVDLGTLAASLTDGLSAGAARPPGA